MLTVSFFTKPALLNYLLLIHRPKFRIDLIPIKENYYENR